MPIRDRGTSVLAALSEGHEIGSRAFVLAGHSLGGLVIKQMVRHSATMDDQFARFVDHLKGVVFFSTPHTGSGLASLISHLKLIRATDLARDLSTNAANLRELDDWYRNYVSRTGLAHLSFYEKQQTNGVRVVDETSGDPKIPGMTAIPVDADHRSVCKFDDRLDTRYRQVQRFISRQVGLGAVEPKGSHGLQSARPLLATTVVAQSADVAPEPLWTDAAALGRLAVLALMSEQLPSGGWARSLAQWMSAYANASRQQAPDRPAMRENGGIDVTCAAINRLIRLSVGSAELRSASAGALEAGALFLRRRTPASGAVGATTQTRTPPTEVRIRHTAVTLATLLRLQQHAGTTDRYPEVTRSADYLLGALNRWRYDTSGTFGALAVTWDLHELLTHEQGLLGPQQTERLQNVLATTVEEMAQDLLERVTAVPSDGHMNASCARFGAYGNLTSLAQSSFLFSAKLLTSAHREYEPAGLAQCNLYAEVLATCAQLARALNGTTFDALLAVPTVGLPQPDIGLGVQSMSVFRDLADRTNSLGELASVAADRIARVLDQTLHSGDEVDLAKKLTYTHGVQLAGLLDEPDIARAAESAAETPELIRTATGRTLDERTIVYVLKGPKPAVDWLRAVGRVWTRTLDNGHYACDEVRIASDTGAWRPDARTAESLVRVEQTGRQEYFARLWLTGTAETGLEIIPEAADGLVVRPFQTWRNAGRRHAEERFDLIYLPTEATSAGLDLFERYLGGVSRGLRSTASIGLMAVRLGDHRLVTEDGERVLFLEDITALDRVLASCSLRLLRFEVENEDLNGKTAILQFGPRP